MKTEETKLDKQMLLSPSMIDDEAQHQKMLKKSFLMKSFADKKDNRGNCAMEQSEMINQQKLQGKRAMTKLLMVTGISFVFMSGEIVGGYLSGSLAIITDAAHMLSDVAGFLISYFAIYMGSRPSNYQMSFGYHRAEILGALASIMLIWGIIIYLFIEAIHRIVDPEPIDGKIMLITAVVGLVCNIISIFTLHSFGGGHSHGHDHGEGEHSHGEAGKEEGRKLSHCHQPALQGSKKQKAVTVTNKIEAANGDEENIVEHKISSHKDVVISTNNVMLLYEDDQRSTIAKGVNASVLTPADNQQLRNSQTDNTGITTPVTPDAAQDVHSNHIEEEHHHHEHKPGQKCSHNHDHNHEHKHDHAHEHKETKKHNHGHGGCSHGIGGHSHGGHDHENMNIRAAIIHVIGDIVQSIGVVIAALIIFFFPNAKIADPITTMIFTVICIFTTVPIFRDCMSILMEATPKSIDILQCFEEILNIDEIEEIHDFHIWALSQGKMSMSAHIRSSDPVVALRKATKILRDSYGIFHTTIQIEKVHPGTQLGCCDNDHEDHNHPLTSPFFVENVEPISQKKNDKEHQHGSGCKHDHAHDHKHHDHDHKHNHDHQHQHDHEHSHGHKCNHNHDHAHSHNEGHEHHHDNENHDHGHKH